MKNIRMIFLFFVGTVIIFACTNKPNNNKMSSNKQDETVENFKRLEKSDEIANSALGKFDNKVVKVMRSVRELKDNIKKGIAVTTNILTNISEMIQEAKNAQDELIPLLDKLNQDDFGLYERDKERLREKETLFEELKQNK